MSAKRRGQHCANAWKVTFMVGQNITVQNGGTVMSFDVCRYGPLGIEPYWRHMLLDAFARSISALARLRDRHNQTGPLPKLPIT